MFHLALYGYIVCLLGLLGPFTLPGFSKYGETLKVTLRQHSLVRTYIWPVLTVTTHTHIFIYTTLTKRYLMFTSTTHNKKTSLSFYIYCIVKLESSCCKTSRRRIILQDEEDLETGERPEDIRVVFFLYCTLHKKLTETNNLIDN